MAQNTDTTMNIRLVQQHNYAWVRYIAGSHRKSLSATSPLRCCIHVYIGCNVHEWMLKIVVILQCHVCTSLLAGNYFQSQSHNYGFFLFLYQTSLIHSHNSTLL